MKNHIIIKFLAVLLCAASLLGAVGSGLGIFLMTEMDLYDKSVEQVYDEQVEHSGRNLAHQIGMHYASTQLGGTPVALLEQYFGYTDVLYDSGFDPSCVGYALKDGEGNVLDSRTLDGGEGYGTHTFAVTGQYMHFVDHVDKEEEQAQIVDTVVDNHTVENGAVLVDAIPPEGASVSEVQISNDDSSSGAAGGEIGTVFRNQDGSVVLRCPGFDIGNEDPLVTHITLLDWQGELIYEASAEDGVGLLSYTEDGTMIFTSFPVALTPVAEEAAPMTAAEEVTVPPTEESVPTEETAAAEESAPEETGAEDTTEATAAEETAEATEATAAEEEPKEKKKKSKKSDASAETTAETVSEADTGAEPVAAKEDPEAELAEEGTEATEETVAPTVPETAPEETLPPETIPPETIPEPVLINGKPLESYQINRANYYDPSVGEDLTARYVYIPMPEMTLELYVQPGALRSEASFTLMRLVVAVSRYLFPAMGICLLLFAVCAVYLCCAAGKKPKSDEIRPGGLNRIPLDLYGFCVLGGVIGICCAIAEGGDYVLRQNVMVGFAFMAGLGYLAALLVVGFLFACVAQIKTPGGFWWRNSLCGLGLRLCFWLCRKAWQLSVRLEQWASRKGWPLLVRLCKWVWGLIVSLVRWVWNTLARWISWMQRSFDRFLSLLPVTWQWLLAGCAMVLFLFITVAGRFDFGMVLAVLVAFAMVVYGAHCFGELLQTTKKMNKGDLNSKADDKLMVGAFKEFAGDLNDLAGVAIVAAQKQLKSERMKTELITNVSHDIKTPLTSIINYVDLLQKPHTEEEQAQYLEVLDRQSQRLKKLIDDLMDMSKASTGNMAVDITLLDAVEAVNQALGEFADKLDKAQLTPVFRHTEDTVAMMADGRLVWRVLSNLLSNAVKYAMPGTRLYIDLMCLENKVVISLKNISRDELNVDAEELMERFVRGDDSRNTEGSGLGLNIAKSLMELQKGQLQLLVDGDLFKVTLIFPGI